MENWKYPFKYPSLLWKGKNWCTFSSHDGHKNPTAHSMHRTRAVPFKHIWQQSGDGSASQLRAASKSSFLELSQLDVKLDILVSQFLEDGGRSNECKNSSHLAKVASRLPSVKENYYTECPQGMTCLGFGWVSSSS